jgi:hypothetical protein
MTRETRQAAQRWAAFIMTVIAIPLLSWAFARYDASLMKVSRFVQDSSVIMNRDSAWKAAVLERFDRLQEGQDAMRLRLEQIQCGTRINQGCR